MSTTAHVKKASWALLALAVTHGDGRHGYGAALGLFATQGNAIAARDFSRHGNLSKISCDLFPASGLCRRGSGFTWLGSSRDTSPIVTIRRVTIEAHYLDMISTPRVYQQNHLGGFCGARAKNRKQARAEQLESRAI